MADPAVPPFPGEHHRCAECGLDYRTVTTEEAVGTMRALPARLRTAVAAVPPALLARRPRPGAWSVTEYVCHLRDVYVTYTIRLHRARTEDRPVLEPMLNDLRARRFRYAERDVDAVLDDLGYAAAGCAAEAERFAEPDWDRTVTRLPGEERTARWLLRQAAHEGVHHLRDVEATGRAVATAP